jgi:hypothetical protein
VEHMCRLSLLNGHWLPKNIHAKMEQLNKNVLCI